MGKLDAIQVAWISPSAIKSRYFHCVRHTECGIKDFTKMADTFRSKNIAENTDCRGKSFPYF